MSNEITDLQRVQNDAALLWALLNKDTKQAYKEAALYRRIYCQDNGDSYPCDIMGDIAKRLAPKYVWSLGILKAVSAGVSSIPYYGGYEHSIKLRIKINNNKRRLLRQA